MENVRELPRDQWPRLFEVVSAGVRGSRVEVEAASLELGDQTVIEWLPLLGIAFEAQHDQVVVMLEGLDHLILHPQSIAVLEGPAGIAGVAVVTQDDMKEVVRFRAPLQLPAHTG